jgi:anaerobic selenocysteine-containing dehydrogenase
MTDVLEGHATGETRVVRTYCSLCGVGCPAAVTVDGDRVLDLDADRGHPRGGIACSKGRAAPEIHDHPHRVNYPLRRTRPKSADDPGWERCSWDEALDLVATTLLRIRDESGPQAVAFGRGTGSGTGLKPAEPWVQRLAAAFGSPNYLTNAHLCNWARDGGSYYTFGEYPLPPPDVERSNCVVVWGANPSATLLDLAAKVTKARRRGARLLVVDPRKVGLAARADLVLQVRPGTDGALALAFVHLLIERRWYDDEFVRRWTNAPFLVREDSGRMLSAGDVVPGLLVDDSGPVVIDARTGSPSSLGGQVPPAPEVALSGTVHVELRDGRRVRCRPVFELLAEMAGRYHPEAAARITGVPVRLIRDAARLLAENRPVAHHVWNGIVQHTNATQTARAIEVCYALLGDWDRPGGNVVRPLPRTAPIPAAARLPDEQAALRLGRAERPLGPPAAPPGNVTGYDLYTAILDADPYQVRALLSFGGNTLLNTGDPVRGREAFRRLEFFAQAELFHTPTTRFADVLLPAGSFLESDVLIITGAGFAERRRPAVEPLYQRRPDIEILVDLAERLGLGEWFAGGSVEAAYDEVLAPAGLSWAGLLDRPEGVDVSPPVEYEKYTAAGPDGRPRGFATPSGRAELFVDRFAAHGQPPLPEYAEPASSPLRSPALAREYPLVLTNAKSPRYLHSQHRGVAALRRREPDPTVELHPDTAARFGIDDGNWVLIETPRAAVRARAAVTTRIVPGVVCAYHGWWEDCDELGLTTGDPFESGGANVNLLVDNDVRDPVSGAVPHRSSLCRIRPDHRTSPGGN